MKSLLIYAVCGILAIQAAPAIAEGSGIQGDVNNVSYNSFGAMITAGQHRSTGAVRVSYNGVLTGQERPGNNETFGKASVDPSGTLLAFTGTKQLPSGKIKSFIHIRFISSSGALHSFSTISDPTGVGFSAPAWDGTTVYYDHVGINGVKNVWKVDLLESNPVPHAHTTCSLLPGVWSPTIDPTTKAMAYLGGGDFIAPSGGQFNPYSAILTQNVGGKVSIFAANSNGTPIQAIQYSPDGKWLAVSQGNDVRIFDTATGYPSSKMFQGICAAWDPLQYTTGSSYELYTADQNPLSNPAGAGHSTFRLFQPTP